MPVPLALSRPTRLAAITAASVAVLALSGVADFLSAQEAKPGRIKIEYVVPKNPEHQMLYDMLKQRNALEQLQEIFNPVKMPMDITIKAVGCDGMVNAWYQRPTLTICYEYLADIRNTTPKETTPEGITPQDAVIGQFFSSWRTKWVMRCLMSWIFRCSGGLKTQPISSPPT